MHGRDAWVEIDEQALRFNMRLLRETVGPSVKIYACLKIDAYGFGAGYVAKVAASEGIDAFACGDADDADRIRSAGVDLPVLLYPGTVSESLGPLSQRGYIVTAHDRASLEACLAITGPFYLKVDCGFGRMGFPAGNPGEIIEMIRHRKPANLIGVYSHFYDQHDAAAVSLQGALFQQCVDAIEPWTAGNLERNVGASRVLVSSPQWALSAINPGGLIYGTVERTADKRSQTRNVFAALKGRIIAIREMPKGTKLGYAAERFTTDKTIAVVPLGFADGYPRLPANGYALAGGRRVAIIGPRNAEYTTLDITGIPGLSVGAEAVFIGRQGTEEITVKDVAEAVGVPSIDLIPRLLRNSRKSLR